MRRLFTGKAQKQRRKIILPSIQIFIEE